MRRTASAGAGLLVFFLAGALPAAGQQWVGERLCAGELQQDGEFGSAVAVGSNGTIAVGDYRHDVVYLFRRNDQGICERLEPPVRGRAGEWFGFDVAIDENEDRSLLLVGAPKAGGTETVEGPGAAYLVELTEGRNPRPVLVPPVPNPVPGDEIGSSVAISGEILAIGARGAENRRGRVYAGRRGDLRVVPPHRDLAPRAELGQAVALSGTTLVMGAPSPFQGTSSPGVAYVVMLSSSDGAPGEPVPLSSGGLEPEAAFGYAVAVDGDRILVGAPLADGTGTVTDAGVVYRFRRRNGTWTQDPETQPLLTGGRGDQLGVSIALEGETALVGARYANGTRGAVYLKEGDGPPQALEQTVPPGAQYGFSVAFRNGILVAGAFQQGGTGAAYLFHLVSTVRLVVDDREVEERDTGLTVALRTLDGNPAPRDLTFRITTQDDTAKSANGDYSPLTADITLPMGMRDVTMTFSSMSFQDALCEERKETFRVVLLDLAGTRIDAEEVVIVDDDKGSLVLTPDLLRTSEDGTPATLEMGLTCPPSKDVNVSFEAIPPLASFSPPTRTFTDQGPLEVSVSGTDNAVCGPRFVSYEIVARTTSEDPRFDGLTDSIQAENADDERACLSVDKSVCTDGGGTVVYTISFANEVAGVPDVPAELLDDLPSGISVVTASADRGTATADPVDNSVRWTGLVPTETVTLTIVAALDGPPGPELGNQAELNYPRDDRGHRNKVLVDFSDEVADPCPD